MAVNLKKKRALGRGLGSLISSKPVPVATGPSSGKASGTDGVRDDKIVTLPVSDGSAESGDSAGLVRFVSISTVAPNPDQPRKFFEESEVEELVSSIRTHGVLQPILVRPGGENSKELQIVAGERRWRAASRAKLAQIPVIIRDIDDRDCLEISLVENVQRSNLTPLEEAHGYQELISRFQLTQGEVAEKVGKERATVSNMVRLLKLPLEVQKRLDNREISVGHAKAILTVKEPKLQIALASKVISEGLSVRELERIVARKVSLKNQRKVSSGSAGKQKAKYRDISEELQKVLGAKVKIQEASKEKGKILVDFFSFEELERITDLICFQD